MKELNPKIAIPEFQAQIRAAENCSEMLEACRCFVSFHGGFSSAPDVRQKFNSVASGIKQEKVA